MVKCETLFPFSTNWVENGSTALGSRTCGAIIKRGSLVDSGLGATGAFDRTAGVLFGAKISSGVSTELIGVTIGLLGGSNLGKRLGEIIMGKFTGRGAVTWATCSPGKRSRFSRFSPTTSPSLVALANSCEDRLSSNQSLASVAGVWAIAFPPSAKYQLAIAMPQ